MEPTDPLPCQEMTPPTRRPEVFRDIGIGLFVALLFGATAVLLVGYLGSLEFEDNEWFDSDVRRYIKSFESRFYWGHVRSQVHPLFSLLVCTPINIAHRQLGIRLPTLLVSFLALAAASWGIAYFAVLRLIGLCILDTLLICLLALSSSSVLFWVGIVETYVLGSLTMIVPLMLGATRHDETRWSSAYFVATACSLSVTTTNFVAGILLCATTFHWRRAIQLLMNALLIVLVLFQIQWYLYPASRSFLTPTLETRYVVIHPKPTAAGSVPAGSLPGMVRRLRSIFLDSIVMPRAHRLGPGGRPDLQSESLTISRSNVTSESALGCVGIALWILLLSSSVPVLIQGPANRRFRIMLVGILGFQVVLHLVYGHETFLYSMHFGPFLILAASFSLKASSGLHRAMTRLAFILLIAVLACNNLAELGRCHATLQSFLNPSRNLPSGR